MKMYAVLVFVTVALLEQTEASVRCFECVDMPHPQDCPTVTTCSQNEICHIKQFVTSGGQILYNSGCLSKERCKSSGKRAVPVGFPDVLRSQPISDEVNREMAKRQETVSSTDIATCIQCCDGDYCNVEGCGAIALPRQNRGPKCFSCNAQADPESCRDTQLCDREQVCAIYRPLNRLTYDEWSTECMSELQCKAIVQVESQQLGSALSGAVGKRDVITVNQCPRCCTDDLCNHSCRQNLTVIQSTISPTKPSTYPTIKPTTKIITVPTHPTTKSTTKPTTQYIPPSATSTYSSNPTIKLTHPTTKPTVDPAIQCQADGYIYDPLTHLCLKFFESPKLNWTEAQNYCNLSQGQLAIIAGGQKIKDILSLYKNGGHTSPLWVGATDFGSGRVFTFTDGNWITLFPSKGNGLKDSNCLYLTNGAFEGYGPCPDRHGFICERKSSWSIG